MAKLYKKVTLFVSRNYHRGDSGLEKGAFVFFRNMEEYDALSKERGWEMCKPFGSSWCTRPKEIDAHVDPKKYSKFINEGEVLPSSAVLFSADKIAEVRAVDYW